jgi:hypothetical protein
MAGGQTDGLEYEYACDYGTRELANKQTRTEGLLSLPPANVNVNVNINVRSIRYFVIPGNSADRAAMAAYRSWSRRSW